MQLKATIAYLGLGSNLQQPQQQIVMALQKLTITPELELRKVSGFVQSAPQGNIRSQPDFINAVCCISTKLTAHALLEELLDLELELGRVRLEPDGPRVIDLDLLLYGQSVIRDHDLTVPHPCLHQRRFVLQPLLEIAPDISIPGLGPACDYLQRCMNQRVDVINAERYRVAS